jgi:cytochrome P450
LIWRIMRNEEGTWSMALPWANLVGGLDLVGPFLFEFDAHRDVRRLLQPSFSPQAVAGYLEVSNGLHDRAIEAWLRRGHIGFKAEIRRLLAAISGHIYMGLEDEEGAARLDRAMKDSIQGVFALIRRSSLSPGWRRARRGSAALWNLMRSQSSVSDGTDLFCRLRRTDDEAGWLKDESTRMRLFAGMMIAAFNTVSASVTSMAYLLAKHPAWQERLRSEVNRLGAEQPDQEALKSLEEVGWAWKETMRLFSVQGVFPRQAMRDTQLGEYRIPARTLVLSLLGTTANDPEWWTEPTRFDPERFSPDRAEDKRHKAIYLPFGAGAHVCIGARLAEMQVKAFWQAFLRRARFRLVPDYTARHGFVPEGIVSGDVRIELERV